MTCIVKIHSTMQNDISIELCHTKTGLKINVFRPNEGLSDISPAVFWFDMTWLIYQSLRISTSIMNTIKGPEFTWFRHNLDELRCRDHHLDELRCRDHHLDPLHPSHLLHLVDKISDLLLLHPGLLTHQS